jgi:putative addiction module antidote
MTGCAIRCKKASGYGSGSRHDGPCDITYVITKVTDMYSLKLTQVGNSVGAIFPKELLARLQLEKGDELYVTESPDGLRITLHNPEFEAQMKVARDIMKKRRTVLRELAK